MAVQISTTLWNRIWRYPTKLHMHLSSAPAILVEIILWKYTPNNKNTYTKVIGCSITCNCLYIENSLNKLWYIHTMEYCVATKKEWGSPSRKWHGAISRISCQVKKAKCKRVSKACYLSRKKAEGIRIYMCLLTSVRSSAGRMTLEANIWLAFYTDGGKGWKEWGDGKWERDVSLSIPLLCNFDF